LQGLIPAILTLSSWLLFEEIFDNIKIVRLSNLKQYNFISILDIKTKVRTVMYI